MVKTTKRVLVAEVDPGERHRIVKALTDGGFACLEAGDGRAALQLARSERPALALIDLTLPLLDGVATITALKQDQQTQRIRVVAMGEGGALRRHASVLPADGALVKPFDLDALLAVVTIESQHVGTAPWSRFFA